MKIVVVMTYYERQFQLQKSLKSIAKTKHNDLEIVIVDDQSECSVNSFLSDIPTTVIRTKNKLWTNPEPVLNTGIREAIQKGADIIITQNAECYHAGDVISYASHIKENQYISFGCYSIDKETTFSSHNIEQIIHENNKGAEQDGQNAWYNHPKYRPVGYDFCGAITTENMIKLNGFDERYSDGCAYGDDDYLSRIKKLGLSVIITKNPFVVHQWHYTGKGVPADKAVRVERNRKLFEFLKATNQIRAIHIFTPNVYESTNHGS